jgi:hypothetical protein
LIRSIWKWLVLGVLVSAAITYFVPPDAMSQYSAFQGFPALLITLIVSLPLYVCATASVPIAAALVASGFPTGAALVFLMAGPATNVATLGAVYRVLGRRPLIAYLTTIVAGSLLAGIAFNHLVATPSILAHAHSHSSTWWSVLSSMMLAMIVLGFVIQEGIAFFRRGADATDKDGPVFVELGSPPK